MRTLRILGLAALGLFVMAQDAMAQRRAGRLAVACAERSSAEWWAGAKARRQGPRLVW